MFESPSAPAWIAPLLDQADAAEARGNPALALAILQRAAATRAPGLQSRLGLALARAGRLPEAARALRGALMVAADDAQIRYALGLCLVAGGRYREGARLLDARFELPGLGARKPAGFPFPEWRGEALAGKRLAVFPELSLADQVLAARFIPGLQAGGVEVLLFAPPELTRLYATSFPAATVVPAAGAVEFDEPHAWTTIGALIALAADSGPPPPCLAAPSGGPGARVALAVAGLPDQAAQRLRDELPGERIEPVMDGDLAEAAAAFSGAELVVCLDGPAAQLASGLGLRTLVLAPARDPHWSFAMGPQAPLWHPTCEVFRADPRGEWSSAIERLVTQARARLGA